MSAVLDRVELLACPPTAPRSSSATTRSSAARGTSTRRSAARPCWFIPTWRRCSSATGRLRGGRAGSRPAASANGRLRRPVRRGADRGNARKSLPRSRPASQVSDSRVSRHRSARHPAARRRLQLGPLVDRGRARRLLGCRRRPLGRGDRSRRAGRAATRRGRELRRRRRSASSVPGRDVRGRLLVQRAPALPPGCVRGGGGRDRARARPARPRLRPDGERVRADETCSTSRSGAGRGIRSTSCIAGLRSSSGRSAGSALSRSLRMAS